MSSLLHSYGRLELSLHLLKRLLKINIHNLDLQKVILVYLHLICQQIVPSDSYFRATSFGDGLDLPRILSDQAIIGLLIFGGLWIVK